MPSIIQRASDRSCRFWLALLVVASYLLTESLFGSTFLVVNANDAGAGSFRQAITDANNNPGADTIHFQIPGTGPFTINLSSTLPPLNETVVVDATTQPGYLNHPLIELNGTSAGGNVVGLRVAGGNSTIRGLAINRFDADGIRLDSNGNLIQANFIGTDIAGGLARGNGQYGIFVFGTGGNQIGGTNATDRNVISGGNDTGIYLLNPSATGNLILGNYIGVNAAGTGALSNDNNGITLFNAPANTMGGTVAGARNLIAGNGGSGINLNGSGSTGNVIQGNYLGLNAAGTTALTNAADGITFNSAPGNLVGGTNSGAGNVISGNGKAGVFLNGAGAARNVIEGNLIGTDPTGLIARGNAFAGITLSGAVSNTIGGQLSASRNVISGNRQDGVFIASSSFGNRIVGNLIGVNANGTAALPNAWTGLTLSNSSFNLVGGDPTGAPSVVAANGNVGIWITGATARSNTVAGTLIGTSLGGTNALGNTRDGLRITDGAYNQIGGVTATERNVLSGNGFGAGVGAGVLIEGTSAAGNLILGNHIGTDINGVIALPNRNEGIYLNRARGNSIGGDLVGAGNLISGNTTRGLRMTNAWANTIRGNRFGTASNGISTLANGQFNLELEENSISNAIGGLTVGAGNTIAFSGGGFAAVRVRDLATNNAILGNACFSNTGLALDLSAAGVTANDNCDTDSGGNQRQNFPLLAQAYSGVNTAVRGTINSAANTVLRLQFFSSPACDASGNGPGKTFLGDKLVTIGAACSSSFSALFTGQVAPGSVITATATDLANNTSEFSTCLAVAPCPPLSIAAASPHQLELAWPDTALGFVLKEATNLSPPIVWTSVTNLPTNTLGQFKVNVFRQYGQRYYLLSFE